LKSQNRCSKCSYRLTVTRHVSSLVFILVCFQHQQFLKCTVSLFRRQRRVFCWLLNGFKCGANKWILYS